MPRGRSPHALLQSHEDAPVAFVRPGEGEMPTREMPTRSRPRVALSEFSEGRWAAEPPIDPPLHPTELDLIQSMRSSRVKRALLALAGFLIMFCIGIAATLAWQSHGNTVRGMIANLSPQLVWLAPPAAPVAEAAPTASASAVPDQIA